MPFSASTCLTFTGNTSLGPTLQIFSDVDGFLDSFATVPTTSILSGSCPYIITDIPDGATTLRLQDYSNNCCVDIPIQSNDLCVTCNLDFTLLSASTNSLIVAGNLTGSCSNITDYVVYWYGPDNPNQVGYVSGSGSLFSYQFPHPLTGNSAIFAQSGSYIPVIDKVRISGLTFSQTGGTNNFLANLDCFSPVNVDPLRCDNGNTVGDYSHVYQYSGATSGGVPLPLSASFELSSTTKFFAFTFQGFTVDDCIDLSLDSVNYPVEIKLESIKVGTQASTQSFTTFPRSVPTAGAYGRVLCLTGLTITAGDKINITVTPNTTNNTTNWRLRMQCLDDWECDACLDNNVTNPYKILSGSVITTSATCSGMNLSYIVSGCSASTVTSSSAFKYLLFNANNSIDSSLYSSANGEVTRTAGTFNFNNSSCSLSSQQIPACFSPPNTNTITYEKSISGGTGLISITCDTYSDLEFFKSRYDTHFSLYSGSTDPTNINYYRMSNFAFPNPLGAINCGDGTNFTQIGFHLTTAVVTTGGTGPWSMFITMPTISAQTSFTTCQQNCQTYIETLVSSINNSSTGTSNNFIGTTTKGSKATNPFVTRYRLSLNTNPFTAQTIGASTYIQTSYMYQTIPWSGVSNTLIPSLSGLTCYPYGNCDVNGLNCRRWYYYHRIILTNPSDPRDFEIYASPITDLQYSGSPNTAIYELALTYSGQTVTYANPTYCI
jgi:hypothetical protein